MPAMSSKRKQTRGRSGKVGAVSRDEHRIESLAVGTAAVQQDRDEDRRASFARAKRVTRAVSALTSAAPHGWAKGSDAAVALKRLRELCMEPGGLGTSVLRARAWPLLLGIARTGAGGESIPPDPADVAEGHDNEHQYPFITLLHNLNLIQRPPPTSVKLDVDRSLWRFPKGIRHHERVQLRRGITDVLDAILGPNPHLHYYQGFHEICAVLMLTCGRRSGLELLRLLCRCHVRDYLEPTLACSIAHCEIVFGLLHAADAPLYAHLISADLLPHFAVSWILTWFTHDIDDLDIIRRVFDACLAQHPFFPAYIGAAIVRASRERLLALPADLSTLHKTMLSLPRTVDFDVAIADACKLILAHPPDKIHHSPSISQASRELLIHSKAARAYRRFSSNPGAFAARVADGSEGDGVNDGLLAHMFSGTWIAAARGAAAVVATAAAVALAEAAVHLAFDEAMNF